MTEPKKENPADNCPVCGGNLAPGKYDHVVGGEHVEHRVSGAIRWVQHIILDVPARICTTCGSPWVTADDEVSEKLQTYVRKSAEQGVFVSTVGYRSISPTTH